MAPCCYTIVNFIKILFVSINNTYCTKWRVVIVPCGIIFKAITKIQCKYILSYFLLISKNNFKIIFAFFQNFWGALENDWKYPVETANEIFRILFFVVSSNILYAHSKHILYTIYSFHVLEQFCLILKIHVILLYFG